MSIDSTTPTASPAAAGYTEQQVRDATNHAVDDILNAACVGDTWLRDAINLMVNTTLSYLSGDADNLAQAINATYDEDPDTVLGWVREAT
jgi:hypothetical protein